MCNNNYVVYHLHSDYSSCTTNIDSVTKVDMYVEKARELGMKALAFSEHGNILNWYEKKSKIESAGMKYIHAVECYLTETTEEKIRDNYHLILIAKNKDGFREINKLMTVANNRTDGHYYYVPRISFEDLCNTSDNIIVTTACLASALGKGTVEFSNKFIDFLSKNKNRCFLEIQHHNVQAQKDYNRYIIELSRKINVPLIAGTDTHSLNEELAEAREILQKAKNIFFGDEGGWDLTFKSYDELVDSYRRQGVVEEKDFLTAINNTNTMSDMVEPFEIDKNPKYPKLYENPEEELRKRVFSALENNPYVLKRYKKEDVVNRINEELSAFHKTSTEDFMLFEKFVKDWEIKNGIHRGPGRGSINGSMCAYLLGLTDMDSMRFGLRFWRFINPERVSNADVDTDLYDTDREKVRKFLLNVNNLNTAMIAAFTTISTKGAVRDIGRALQIPLAEVDKISKELQETSPGVFEPTEKQLKKYPELFKFVKLLDGVIVTQGPHPAGVLVSSLDIESEIGLYTTSKQDGYISCLDMYGLDACMWTKKDLLGLDAVGIINKCCDMIGIEPITPDTIDIEDWEVWKDIREDTTGIFQWESPYAQQTLKSVFYDQNIDKFRAGLDNFSYLKLFSFANALIRPCGTSLREGIMRGEVKKTGIKPIDDLLKNELGCCIIQEDFMEFFMRFCGFSLLEADVARKKIAKKGGTEGLIPAIKQGFYANGKIDLNLSDEEAEKVLTPILNCVRDASRYAFNQSHSDAYSFIGYACGWLRHYYPYEFITTCLNVWEDKEEKTSKVIEYANSIGIRIEEPKFGKSSSKYFLDKENKKIYKGMKSIKFMNDACADELYALRNRKYNSFIDVLRDIESTSADSRKIDVLIKIDFFSDFGNCAELTKIKQLFEYFKEGDAKEINKKSVSKDSILYPVIKRYSRETEKKYILTDTIAILNEAEQLLKNMGLKDVSIRTKIQNQQEYLGYISFKTNKEEDRRKLIITEIRPLLTKDKTKAWAYALSCLSKGSGKKSELLVRSRTFDKNKLMEYDVIQVEESNLKKETYNGRSSWYLSGYRIITSGN